MRRRNECLAQQLHPPPRPSVTVALASEQHSQVLSGDVAGEGASAREKAPPPLGEALAFSLLPLKPFHHTFPSCHVKTSPSKTAAKHTLEGWRAAAHPCLALVLGPGKRQGWWSWHQAGLKQGPGSLGWVVRDPQPWVSVSTATTLH